MSLHVVASEMRDLSVPRSRRSRAPEFQSAQLGQHDRPAIAPYRLRAATVAWGFDDFDVRQRGGEQRLWDQVARMIDSGRLDVRSLLLFRDDPRAPRETGPLGIYQLGAGPLQNAPPSAPPPFSSPPPLRTAAPSIVALDPDVPNELAQAETLQRAAKGGTPFCAICEAMKAARAAGLA